MEPIPHIDHATKEQVAIKEIRESITDVILEDAKFDDDFYLLLWLKAQKMNVTKAAEMIRNSLKWRKERKIYSNYKQEFSEEFLKTHLIQYSQTNEGIPVTYLHLSTMDWKNGIKTVGNSEWVRFWGMVFSEWEDKMIEFNKTQNEDKTGLTSDSAQGIVLLADVKDYSALQLIDTDVLKCCVEVAQILSNYFPGIASTLIYYNINPIFSTLLNAVKPFLTWPNSNLEVYGTDENVWRERILRIVSLEDLNELESQWK